MLDIILNYFLLRYILALNIFYSYLQRSVLQALISLVSILIFVKSPYSTNLKIAIFFLSTHKFKIISVVRVLLPPVKRKKTDEFN